MADYIVRLDHLISEVRGSSRALLSCHALTACGLMHSICMFAAATADGQEQGARRALLPEREAGAEADPEVLPAHEDARLPEDHRGAAHHDPRAQRCTLPTYHKMSVHIVHSVATACCTFHLQARRV
jgi:hypothetical protein